MKQAKQNPTNARGENAITLLTQDHKEVKKLFSDFKKLKESEGSEDQKAELVGEICTALSVHAQVEEEIFYPAVREAIDDDDLMDEADEEHNGAKALIAQLEEMDPEEDHYDAKVIVLSEYIDHHVKEEQDEMFPKVKKSKIDLAQLGAQIMQRKEELLAEREKSPATANKRSYAA